MNVGEWVFHVASFTSPVLTPAVVQAVGYGFPDVHQVQLIHPDFNATHLVAETARGAHYLEHHLKRAPIRWAVLRGKWGDRARHQIGRLDNRANRRLPEGVGWCTCCGVAVLADLEKDGPLWLCRECRPARHAHDIKVKAPRGNLVDFRPVQVAGGACSCCQRLAPVLVVRKVWPAPHLEERRPLCQGCLENLDALRLIQEDIDKRD